MRISFILIAMLSVLLMLGCKKEETRVTPSGYEYIVYTSSGGAKPNPGDYVYFHAQMRNGDSVYYASRQMGQTPFLQIPTEFDQELNANRTPSPVEEVLREMAVGDSVTIIIRLDTLPTKPPGFEDAKEMYYDVVSLDIKDPETFERDATLQRDADRSKREAAMKREAEVANIVTDIVKQYKSGALNSKLTTTESGLKYLILEEGKGALAANRLVDVHYYGTLTDGTMFDNSFTRGSAFTFTPGKGSVIKGWDEGIALLKEGAKAMLFIPSDLGYGDAGSGPIPGGAELVFYVELEKVN